MKIEGKAPLGPITKATLDDFEEAIMGIELPIRTPTEKDYIDAAGERLDIAKAQQRWTGVLLEMSRERNRQDRIEMVRRSLAGRKWSHRYSGPPMTIISNPGTTPPTITELEKDDTHGY